MAEEPLPKDFKAGHDEDDVPPSIPASAEDRKTAAALSSLEARSDEEEGENKANVDTEALGKAMNRLDVKEDGAAKKEEGEKKKAVKLDQEDVQLVVSRPLNVSNTRKGTVALGTFQTILTYGRFRRSRCWISQRRKLRTC